MNVKHLLLRKGKLLRKKVWKNALALKGKKVQGILALLSSAVYYPQNRVSDFFLIYFAREIKGFYQSSVRNKVYLWDIMNVSPNILTKNWDFKKWRHGLVDETAMITITLVSFCHWKTLVHFYLRKKRFENKF